MQHLVPYTSITPTPTTTTTTMTPHHHHHYHHATTTTTNNNNNTTVVVVVVVLAARVCRTSSGAIGVCLPKILLLSCCCLPSWIEESVTAVTAVSTKLRRSKGCHNTPTSTLLDEFGTACDASCRGWRPYLEASHRPLWCLNPCWFGGAR